MMPGGVAVVPRLCPRSAKHSPHLCTANPQSTLPLLNGKSACGIICKPLIFIEKAAVF